MAANTFAVTHLHMSSNNEDTDFFISIKMAFGGGGVKMTKTWKPRKILTAVRPVNS